MAHVRFTVIRDLPLPARAVFGELVNWRGHADWVPLTRVQVIAGDGGAGTVFVATTGIGPFALPDRMRVDDLDPLAMTVRITKIGPVLSGSVWIEDIRVPYVPQFLAKPIAAATSRGFQASIGRLAKLIARRDLARS